MPLPRANLRLILADGQETKVTKVWYSTEPRGTYRVQYKLNGKDAGCKAWFRKDHYVERVPPAAGQKEEFDGPHDDDTFKGPLF